MVEEVDSRVEIAHARLGEKLVITSDKAREPRAVRIVERSRLAGFENDGASRRIAHGHRVRQNLLHPFVRRKSFAFLDSNRRERPRNFQAVGFVWFVLDDIVDFFVEMKAVGMNGVERSSRNVMNFIAGGFAASDS